MKTFANVGALVGNTPLVKLANMVHGHAAAIFCKLEACNPAASIKDRIAVGMIEAAEREGVLKPGGVIVEATSGNTGLGLAMVAAARGYKVVITMPESMSVERRMVMRQLGAKIVLTDAAKGMTGAIEKAEEIAAETENSFMPKQFENPANPATHERTTGPEILRDLDGKVDIFVAGIGTGGTITGVGRALKRHNHNIKVIGVEPDESAVLSGGQPGPHHIQGIGAGFRPLILDMSVVDRIFRVKGLDAIIEARELAFREGILGGISSGANIKAAVELALLPENHGKNIVTIVCDTGERYLSTPLFQQ